jgi:dihydroorotate dehydrogenase (NAD+) catalytic subunit
MIDVFGASFQNPVLLAAGTAGFGREVAGVIDLDRLGGVITKAVSPEPRLGNPSPRVAEFRGGMLNSVGLANPGLARVAEVELTWLERHLQRAKVIVNVVGNAPGDYVAVVRGLRDRAVVTAFELNVSCPNTEQGGEEFGANRDVLSALVRACVDATDTPLIVKLAPTLPDIAATAEVAAVAGAAGFSVVNTMPGFLYRELHGGLPAEARLGAGNGGVSGPALLPVGVLATRRVHQRTGLPVVGIGGIRVAEDVKQYLEAGATLVGVGTAFLADPRCPERLAAAWRNIG